MFGWFGKGHEPTDDSDQHRGERRHNGSRAPQPSQSTAAPDESTALPPVAIPGPLVTAHDEILAQLSEAHPSLNLPGRRAADGADGSTTGGSTDDGKGKQKATEHEQPQNAKAATVNDSEPLYDPFTGILLGSLSPPPPPRKESLASSVRIDAPHAPRQRSFSSASATADFDAQRDELWTHLARVRALQADIATMHVQMDGGGLGERKRANVGRRVSSTVGGMGAGPRGRESESGDHWEEEDEDAERAREREEEFGRLAGRFAGRKEAVDGVMEKLGELSQALTAFHALRTPTNTFPRSRSDTEDTATTMASPSATHNPFPPASGLSLSSLPVGSPSSFGQRVIIPETPSHAGLLASPRSLQPPLVEEPEGYSV